jgi:hypothetical protein
MRNNKRPIWSQNDPYLTWVVRCGSARRFDFRGYSFWMSDSVDRVAGNLVATSGAGDQRRRHFPAVCHGFDCSPSNMIGLFKLGENSGATIVAGLVCLSEIDLAGRFD